MIAQNKLGVVRVNLTPKLNGGENVLLTTKFYRDSPMENFYMTQELVLNSYGNSTVLNFSIPVFTPDMLRYIADRLDEQMILHTLTNP